MSTRNGAGPAASGAGGRAGRGAGLRSRAADLRCRAVPFFRWVVIGLFTGLALRAEQVRHFRQRNLPLFGATGHIFDRRDAARQLIVADQADEARAELVGLAKLRLEAA